MSEKTHQFYEKKMNWMNIKRPLLICKLINIYICYCLDGVHHFFFSGRLKERNVRYELNELGNIILKRTKAKEKLFKPTMMSYHILTCCDIFCLNIMSGFPVFCFVSIRNNGSTELRFVIDKTHDDALNFQFLSSVIAQTETIPSPQE